MGDNGFSVGLARWPDDRDALAAVRERVFVREQGVPPALEWDEHDSHAIHLIARDRHGSAIGTARLLPGGQIGRMAVLPQQRGRGVGTRLLAEVLDVARARGLASVFLNAQVQVRDFYARHGFTVTGDVFEEAGIPHVRMVLRFRRP